MIFEINFYINLFTNKSLNLSKYILYLSIYHSKQESWNPNFKSWKLKWQFWWKSAEFVPQSKSNVAIESSNLPTWIKAWVFHNFIPLFTIITVRYNLFNHIRWGASQESTDPVDPIPVTLSQIGAKTRIRTKTQGPGVTFSLFPQLKNIWFV